MLILHMNNRHVTQTNKRMKNGVKIIKTVELPRNYQTPELPRKLNKPEIQIKHQANKSLIPNDN